MTLKAAFSILHFTPTQDSLYNFIIIDPQIAAYFTLSCVKRMPKAELLHVH